MTKAELLAAYAAGQRNFSGVDLEGADLDDANLSGANLEDAYLPGAQLVGANLSGANLSGANLECTNLLGANLSGANLKIANLLDANLSNANLKGANLAFVNLLGANLSGASLHNALGITWAYCGWTHHGECDRPLLGVIVNGEARYFCGCFSGTEAELREYISKDPTLAPSRIAALEFVAAKLKE
jgi:hypothetical protein